MGTDSKATAAATAADGVGGGGDGELQDRKKKATRKEVRAALKALTEDEMTSQSAAIAAHILDTLPLFRATTAAAADGDAAVVKLGLYVHCAKLREVETTALLRAALALPNVKLFVPIVDEIVSPPSASSNATPTMRFLRIVSLETDLEAKCMGILEPTELESDGVTPRENLEGGGGGGGGGDGDAPLDLLLVPGLAFDAAGNRLGRGGGFYDAFMARYEALCAARGWAPPPTMALTYSQQLLRVGDVPMEPHDRRVDALATPDGLVGCTETGARLIRGVGRGDGVIQPI